MDILFLISYFFLCKNKIHISEKSPCNNEGFWLILLPQWNKAPRQLWRRPTSIHYEGIPFEKNYITDFFFIHQQNYTGIFNYSMLFYYNFKEFLSFYSIWLCTYGLSCKNKILVHRHNFGKKEEGRREKKIKRGSEGKSEWKEWKEE